MQSIRRLLSFGVIYLSLSVAAFAQCGDPPIVEDGSLKGEIEGRARALSKILGEANLRGKFETSRSDVLSRYPNADKLRIDQYYLYVVCVAIFSDNTLTATQKVQEFTKARLTISPLPIQRSNVTIRSNGLWIDNSRIGPVNAIESKIDFELDGEYETTMLLTDEEFPRIDANLTHGRHTISFVVDVRTQNRLRVRETCSTAFTVSGPTMLIPSIIFVPYDTIRGRVYSCSVRQV